MSAWKKPSRKACRRKLWITARASSFRSRPLGQQGRVIGQMGAVDPFQRQHFLGGAIPVDRGHPEIRIGLGILRHLRQGGGFEPQIHFERHRAAQGLHGLDQAQPARLRGQALGLFAPRRRSILIDRGIAARCRAAAPSPRPVSDRRRSSPARDAPARSRPPPPRCRTRHRPRRSAGRRRAPRSRPPRPARMAACGPAGFRDRARWRCRPRPAGSPGIVRASHRWGRAASGRRRAGRPGCRLLGRSISRASRKPARAGSGNGVGSTRPSTPSRANT